MGFGIWGWQLGWGSPKSCRLLWLRRPKPSLLSVTKRTLNDKQPYSGVSHLNSWDRKVSLSHLATNHNHAAPACEYHGLLRSNHTLLSLSKVGRPGAHHLVRVLYSYHEVSGLSLSLRPGGPLPPYPTYVLAQNREYPQSHLSVSLGQPSFSSGHRQGIHSGKLAQTHCFPKMSPQKTPVSLPALGNSSAPGYNHSFAVSISLATIPSSRLINLTSVPGFIKCQLSRPLFILATEPHS